jgi:hypothetical protein
MKLTRTVVWSVASLVLASTIVFAAEPPEPPNKEEGQDPGTLLRLEVVMTRSKGDTVVARLPYSLPVHTDGSYGRIYGGIQLPIVVRHEGSNTVMFKNAGGTVEARAWELEGGRFKVELETELGGVYPIDGDTAAQEAESGPSAPVLRSFSTQATLTLRDGETTMLSDSADPITGETVKTEVTLHVAK